jgi:hypothetical protein
MSMKLKHILAGKGVGGWEKQGQSVVEGFLIHPEESGQGGQTRRGDLEKKGEGNRLDPRPRDPDDADATPSGRGGDGGDGV